MIFGYARCSTNESLQDIDRQKRDLESFGVKKENIFWEYESGLKEEREQLNQLFKKISKNDTIVSTEVSRITRSTKQLCNIIEFSKRNCIKLILGSFVVDCTKQLDPMTERHVENDGSICRIREKYY